MKLHLIALFGLTLAGAAHAQSSSVRAILAANHAAVGAMPAQGSADFEYLYSGSGLTGPFVNRYDLASGAFVQSTDANGISNGEGFDGKTPWQRDVSGTNTPQMGGDRVRVAVNRAYRFANLWWRPDYGGAQIIYAGRTSEGGKRLDHLVVTPRRGERFDAWFDADSHQLVRIAEGRLFFHFKETYEDYRPERGVVLPHKIIDDVGLGEGGIETTTLKAARFGPRVPLSTYACPTAPPAGASIAGGAASTTVPFRLLNNHVYVQAMVNGKGPYTFILDSGGHTLLSPRIVSDLGLKPVGEAVQSGAGEGHSTTGFVHFDEIAIGGARLKDMVGFASPIYDKSIEGIPVDGMVGFELMRRLVTQIDYGRHTVTFTDPARFHPQHLGTAIPFVFYDHLPDVQGFIGKRPATFNIDTGSRSEIDVTSPFVAAHHLRSEFAKGVTAVTGFGVGGPTTDYVVRLPSLKLGTVEVDDVPAGLSDAKGGSISNPNYDGNIGSGLLKRFVVTFDYAHQVMYLKRITPTPPDIATFDRSGLWLNAKNGGYEVTDVAHGSAAAAAGIVVGDVITVFNGQPAQDDHLADVRKTLRASPVGTRIRLEVKHGDKARSVVLVLKDQI
ncbi:MAG TPA: aspartyl protease family protein [Caulobacteraceae bacterium]|jgi:predicted aspartyl protease